MYMVYVKHLLFSFSQAASGIFAYICIKCVVCSASFIYNIVILTYMQPFSGRCRIVVIDQFAVGSVLQEQSVLLPMLVPDSVETCRATVMLLLH